MKEEEIISNATEARQASKQNEMTLEEVLIDISQTASCGHYEFIKFGYLDTSIVTNLIERGFSIGKYTSSYDGQVGYKISWY